MTSPAAIVHIEDKFSSALDLDEAPPMEYVYVGPDGLVGKNEEETNLPRNVVGECIPTDLLRMNPYELHVYKDDKIAMFHSKHMLPRDAPRPRNSTLIFFSEKMYARLQQEIGLGEPNPLLLCEVESGEIFGFPHGFVVH
jgi:hypothetical protein